MSEFSLRISAKEIKHAPKEYQWTIPLQWLQHALGQSSGQQAQKKPGTPQAVETELRVDADDKPAELSLRAERSGADILVRGRLQASLRAACFRCLEDVPIAIDTEVHGLFTALGPEIRPPAELEDLPPEELDREYFSGDTLDLAPFIRDQLFLELPMQPLCSEDCSGIPIPDGVRPPTDFSSSAKLQNSIDPRLAPLLSFSTKRIPDKE